MNKGQAALEYLIILIVLLLAIIPLAWLATENTELTRVTAEMSAALNTMVSSADSVYALGPGSERLVSVYIPSGYVKEQAAIYGKETILPFYRGGDFQEAYKTSRADVKGNPPVGNGMKYIKFKMTEDGYVLIGDAKIIGFPGYFSLRMIPGAGDVKELVVKNIHDQALNLDLVYLGVPWISINPTNANLAAGQNTTITITINAPIDAIGFHLNYISIRDSTTTEEYAWVPLRVRVE